MATEFCPKCFKRFMAKQVKRSAGGLAAYVNPRDMTFECKIPKYTHDSHGNPMVYVMDCESEQIIVLTQKEYERRRRTGEL